MDAPAVHGRRFSRALHWQRKSSSDALLELEAACFARAQVGIRMDLVELAQSETISRVNDNLAYNLAYNLRQSRV